MVYDASFLTIKLHLVFKYLLYFTYQKVFWQEVIQIKYFIGNLSKTFIQQLKKIDNKCK